MLALSEAKISAMLPRILHRTNFQRSPCKALSGDLALAGNKCRERHPATRMLGQE